MDFRELVLQLMGATPKAAAEPSVNPAALRGSLRNPGLFEADPGFSTPNADLGYPTATPDRPLTTDPNFSDVVGEPTDSDLMSILNRNINSPEVWAEAQTLLEPARQDFEREAGGYRTMATNANNDAAMIEEILARSNGTPAPPPQSLAERPYVGQNPMTDTPYPNIPGPATNPLADPSTAFASLDRAGPPLAPVGPRQRPAPAPAPAPVQVASSTPPSGRPGWMDTPISALPDNPIIGANPGGPYATMAPPDPFGAPGNTPPPMVPAPASNASADNRRAIAEALGRFVPFAPGQEASLTPNQAAGAAPILSTPRGAPTAPAVLQAQAAPSNVIRLPQGVGGPTGTPPPPGTPPAAPAPTQSDILNRAELERFLAANPQPANPPPAPAAPSPTPLASVTPTPQPPIPPAAAATQAPPAPRLNEELPPALKEQLLQEAFRLTQSRRGQQAPLAPR